MAGNRVGEHFLYDTSKYVVGRVQMGMFEGDGVVCDGVVCGEGGYGRAFV